MRTTRCIVTAWIRVSAGVSDLYDPLTAAVGEPPFESAEMDGVRDMQWVADDTNDALAKADRLKPFCDDPALILLKATTYYAGGSVDAVTIKDERSEFRPPAPIPEPTSADSIHAETGDDRERLVRQIEQTGYRLDGWHDSVDDRDSGPVTVRATHQTTGQTHTVTVQIPGAAGESAALRELAQRIGLPST